MKHIGILAHSAEGATLCYREVWLEGVRRLGAHVHPEITLTGVGMALLLDAWEANDLPALRSAFMRDASKLAGAGADFFICPDNTAHIALESPGDVFPIPCLHIGEVVADQAQREGRRKVGILGTKWTMTGPVYPGAFGRRAISWAIPDQNDRKTIDDIIFGELCLGIFTEESREAYVRIVGKLAEQGCDCVALVCTEIPLLLTEEMSPLPILDSTRLLARGAVAVALGDCSMPKWRGGSVAECLAAAG